jgi:septal ring factor EnvC (AmiA/AmiB activator)
MITLEQHIYELRAELRRCYMTHQERAETEAELAKSIAELEKLERESDNVFDHLRYEIE